MEVCVGLTRRSYQDLHKTKSTGILASSQASIIILLAPQRWHNAWLSTQPYHFPNQHVFKAQYLLEPMV